jgi:hypothetical protein
MEKKPDFFMTFGEDRTPRPVSKCWILASKCKLGDRDDIFIVKVDPTIRYEDKQIGTMEFSVLAIASRLSGTTIEHNVQWPLCVYVSRLKGEFDPISKEIALEQAELIMWAELHNSMESAQSFLEKQSVVPPPTYHPDRRLIPTRIVYLLGRLVSKFWFT